MEATIDQTSTSCEAEETNSAFTASDFNEVAAEWGVGVAKTFKSLSSLLYPEDDSPQPDEEALRRICEIAEEAAIVINAHYAGAGGKDECWAFPSGHASVDEKAGVLLEWWQDRTYCVWLGVGPGADAPVYIFHKWGPDDVGSMIKSDVNGNLLANKLYWLNKFDARIACHSRS